tara:strand:- start:1340 stop:1516 length:177 start_codon:yes stop_codon:yes gene_type:complete
MPKKSPIQKNADTLQEILKLVRHLKNEVNEVKKEVNIIKSQVGIVEVEKPTETSWFWS